MLLWNWEGNNKKQPLKQQHSNNKQPLKQKQATIETALFDYCYHGWYKQPLKQQQNNNKQPFWIVVITVNAKITTPCM